MSMQVVNGAQLQCSFGAAPSTLVVLPINREKVANQFAANIMDHVPMVNIMPFGRMCESGKSHHGGGDQCRDGCPHTNALHSGRSGAVGTGIADRPDCQSAGAEQSVEVHVHLCRHHFHRDARPR